MKSSVIYQIIIFLLSLFVVFPTQANNSVIDSLLIKITYCTDLQEKVDLLNQTADEYYQTIERSTKSLYYASQAKELAIKINYQAGLGFAYHRLGRLEHISYRFNNALDYYNDALQAANIAEHQQLKAMVYNSMGLLHKNNDKPELAIQYLLKAEAISKSISDKRTLASVYLNLARINYGESEFNKEAVYFEKVLELALQLNDSMLIAESYFTIGNRLCYGRSVSLGLSYLEKAEIIIKEAFGNEHPFLFWIYSQIGRSHLELKDFATAENFLTRALLIANWNFDAGNSEFAYVYSYLGDLFSLKEEYDKALNYYHKALSVHKNNFDQGHQDINAMKFRIASVHFALKDFLTAQQIILENQDSWNRKQSIISNLLLGEIFFEKLDFQKAKEHIEKSIALNIVNDGPSMAMSSLNIHNSIYLSERRLTEALYKLSNVYESSYHKTGDANDLLFSLKLIFQCDSVIRRTKELQINVSDNLLYISELNHDIFNNGIKISLLLHNQTQNNLYLHHAFYFLEKSKANMLLEIYNKREILSNNHEVNYFLNEEDKINEKITFGQSKLIASLENNDSDQIDHWRKQIFEFNKSKQALLKKFKEEHFDYFQLQYNPDISSIWEIQDLIDSDQVIVEYFSTEANIFIFIISNETFHIEKVTKGDLENNIEKFVKAILDQDKTEFLYHSHQLYNVLIKPVEPKIKDFSRLIIVPDGSLWQINFDLLVQKSSAVSANYKKLDYLFRDYSISYAYSSTALQYLSGRNSAIKKELLAFSFNEAETSNYRPLHISIFRNIDQKIPGTSREIKAISKLIQGKYYYGKDANKDTFKKMAPLYSIIHLALHGIIDPQRPENSRLCFRSLTDHHADGFLHAFELDNLKLNAELAVLSACNTGSGRIINGEGIMSLGRSFSYSGVKSLMLSMWEVSDTTTPDIMVDFYKGIKRGLTKDEALRMAKLNYLETADEDSSAPIFWGAFYILGDSSPLDLSPEKSNAKMLSLLFGLVIINLIVFYLRNKNIKSRRKPI